MGCGILMKTKLMICVSRRPRAEAAPERGLRPLAPHGAGSLNMISYDSIIEDNII